MFTIVSPVLQFALVALTIVAYVAARQLFLRTKHPLLHPVFISAGAIIIVLRLCHLTFDDYTPAKNWLTWPLGMATAALAVPIFKQRERARQLLLPLIIGATLGCMSAIAIAIGLAALGGLDVPVLNALAVKSVTVSIAVELAKLRGGDPALTAVCTVATGIIGGMFGPFVLTRLRVTDAPARGIALGTISGAIGTSAALIESEMTGALSTLAMITGAIITAAIAPVYIPLVVRLVG